MVTMQELGFVPVQAPPQLANVNPGLAVAVKLTVEPVAKFAAQLPPEQFMPGGVLATDPLPLTVTVSVTPGTKVAVTVMFEVMGMLHALGSVPVQAPLQPTNADVGSGRARRFTVKPLAKSPEHVLPQLMIPELSVTVPLPAPALVTLRVNVGRTVMAWLPVLLERSRSGSLPAMLADMVSIPGTVGV